MQVNKHLGSGITPGFTVVLDTVNSKEQQCTKVSFQLWDG